MKQCVVHSKTKSTEPKYVYNKIYIFLKNCQLIILCGCTIMSLKVLSNNTHFTETMEGKKWSKNLILFLNELYNKVHPSLY